jgi:hypothetical protein
MANEIDEAVEQTLSGGLEQAGATEILRRLDAELQQQTQTSALVLGEKEPEPWVLGGEAAGGFGSMAQRFLSYYSQALHREICDPQGGLKEEYKRLLGGQDLRDQVKALAPVVLAAIGISASLVAPATIAAIVALWLVRVGLEQWCAAPPTATGLTPATP